MDEQYKIKDIKLEEQPTKKRPSCSLEAVLFIFLFVTTLAGLSTILGPYLSNAFNSIFGMGLK